MPQANDNTEPILERLRWHARRLALCRSIERFGVVSAAGGAAAAGWLLPAGAWFPEGRSGWVLLAVAGAAVLAGLGRLLAGATPRDAAAWLDGRYDLADLLKTAHQLALAGERTPPAKAVVRRARKTLDDLPARWAYFRRTRRTAAAAALAGLLCLAGVLLPGRSPQTSPPALSPAKPAVVLAARTQPPDKRTPAADEQPQEPPELAELREALRIGDHRAVERLLTELRRRGLLELPTPSPAGQAGRAEQAPVGNKPAASGDNQPVASRPSRPDGGDLAVVDPRYAPHAAEGSDSPAPQAPRGPGSANWPAVRAEALSADVPAPLRYDWLRAQPPPEDYAR